MKRGACVVLALLVYGCSPQISGAKDAVRHRLRDPDSAQFSEVSVCPDRSVVMGKVNAKNGFGGYAGPKPFYVADDNAVILDDEDVATIPSETEAFNALTTRCFKSAPAPGMTQGDADNTVDAVMNEVDEVKKHPYGRN